MTTKTTTLLLAAILAIGAVATAQAQMVPHQRADGLWVCPNDETRIIVNGDWRIACFTNVPSISMEEFKRLRDQNQRADDAWREREEADRMTRRCKELPRPSFCK